MPIVLWPGHFDKNVLKSQGLIKVNHIGNFQLPCSRTCSYSQREILMRLPRETSTYSPLSTEGQLIADSVRNLKVCLKRETLSAHDLIENQIYLKYALWPNMRLV